MRFPCIYYKGKTQSARYYRYIFILVLILIPSVILPASTSASITIQKGETLYKIAKKYDVPVDLLMKYNNIGDPTKIKEGTEIKIPHVHTIKKGDTLYSISRHYDVSINLILEYNHLSIDTPLAIGSKIIIPVSSTIENGHGHDDERDDSLLWPHSGKREALQGKLTGVAIYGEPGDTIVSVSTGTVVWAGLYRGYGSIVFIKTGRDYVYVYAGNEKILVEVGDSVHPSTPLGILGRNSHDGMARVFFCVYKNRWPIDPSKAPRN
ncbi:MAG: LysM peptidoglycan-binding domain-containing protein [Spirochaetales bacterium]|nr:LysM peptidoglycan-binding domain-containing protein [Spirochaetales bacterium]